MADVRASIEARELRLTNLEKVLYPESGLTKASVIDYYARVAPTMVPHLAGRDVTLVRCPDGVDGERFFEKRCPPHAPRWVRRGGPQGGCVVDDAPTLVWLANLAALELHTHQHRVDDPHPTSVVLDLDPGPPAGILDCARVAMTLRDLLERLGLRCVVKTSGSKGLHLAIPLVGSRRTDHETKDFALQLGSVLAERDPDRVTVVMAKGERPGKVFVDWSQNDANKTTVAAYSLRARARPTVSTPVTWDEVSDAVGGRDAEALAFDHAAVLTRVATGDDPYADNLTLAQDLPTRP